MVSLFLVVLLFLSYLTVVDYKFHEFPKRYVVMFYPIVIFLCREFGLSWMEIVMGFFSIALPMYIVQLFSVSMVYGGLDIVAIPLFSIWFGFNSVLYSLLFVLVYIICHLKVFTKFLKSGKKDCEGRPLIPIMYLSFLIGLCLLNNCVL